MKEIGLNLFSKTFFLTILIKIGPMLPNLTNKSLSINSFLHNMNSILDEHATLKRVNKYELKFKSKLWITPAIQKSIECQKQSAKKIY